MDHFPFIKINPTHLPTAIQPPGAKIKIPAEKVGERWGKRMDGEMEGGGRVFFLTAILDCPSGGYLKANWLEIGSGKDY